MNLYGFDVVAAGAVTGATGAAVGIRGAASARTGKGVYTLTLDQNQFDSTQGVVLCTVLGATLNVALVVHTSDTVKTVSIVDAAGAAQDLDFQFCMVRWAPN